MSMWINLLARHRNCKDSKRNFFPLHAHVVMENINVQVKRLSIGPDEQSWRTYVPKLMRARRSKNFEVDAFIQHRLDTLIDDGIRRKQCI